MYVIVSGRIGYRSFQSLAFFNLDFTFDLCILPDLSALTRLLLQYITPLYILILMMGVLALTRVKGPSRYLGQHSFLHALWLLMLISDLNIAYATFEILHCRLIGPAGAYEFVFVYDPSLLCWTGVHLPWAIIATVLLVLFVVPFPFYAGMAIRFPKFKPITDIYSGVYRDSQRYWVIWNLLRRFFLVILGVFISNLLYRHFSLLIASIIMLAVYILTWPYKFWIDNAFGALVSVALIIFCAITQPEINQYVDPGTAASWMVVALVLAIGCLLLVLEVVLKVLPRYRPGFKYTKDDIFPQLALRKMAKLYSMLCYTMKRGTGFELEEKTAHPLERSSSTVYTRLREPLLEDMSDAEESKRISILSTWLKDSVTVSPAETPFVATSSSDNTRTTDGSGPPSVTYSEVSL